MVKVSYNNTKNTEIIKKKKGKQKAEEKNKRKETSAHTHVRVYHKYIKEMLKLLRTFKQTITGLSYDKKMKQDEFRINWKEHSQIC